MDLRDFLMLLPIGAGSGAPAKPPVPPPKRGGRHQDQRPSAQSNAPEHLSKVVLANKGLMCLPTKSLSFLASLRNLDLSNNQLSDQISALGTLPMLSNLNLGGNALVDAAVAGMCTATFRKNIVVLNLTGNKLRNVQHSFAGPETGASKKKKQEEDEEGDDEETNGRTTGTTIGEPFPKLECLVLAGNKLRRGGGISSVPTLFPTVKTLVISRNEQLFATEGSESELTELKHCQQLHKLSMSHCGLKALPSPFRLARVMELRLSHNQLVTLLPPPVGVDPDNEHPESAAKKKGGDGSGEGGGERDPAVITSAKQRFYLPFVKILDVSSNGLTDTRSTLIALRQCKLLKNVALLNNKFQEDEHLVLLQLLIRGQRQTLEIIDNKPIDAVAAHVASAQEKRAAESERAEEAERREAKARRNRVNEVASGSDDDAVATAATVGSKRTRGGTATIDKAREAELLDETFDPTELFAQRSNKTGMSPPPATKKKSKKPATADDDANSDDLSVVEDVGADSDSSSDIVEPKNPYDVGSERADTAMAVAGAEEESKVVRKLVVHRPMGAPAGKAGNGRPGKPMGSAGGAADALALLQQRKRESEHTAW